MAALVGEGVGTGGCIRAFIGVPSVEKFRLLVRSGVSPSVLIAPWVSMGVTTPGIAPCFVLSMAYAPVKLELRVAASCAM